jgi:hypothetical protein
MEVKNKIIKMKEEEKLDNYELEQLKIEGFKNQYKGEITTISVTDDNGVEHKVYLKPVDFNTYASAYSKLFNLQGGSANTLLAGSVILESCTCEDITGIYNNPKLYATFAGLAVNQISLYQGIIKKN